MQRPTEWPFWHDESWQDPQPRDGQLRHDIALAHYLETQRGWRASTIPSFDLWATTAALFELIARVGRAFFRHLRPALGRGSAVGRFRGGAL